MDEPENRQMALRELLEMVPARSLSRAGYLVRYLTREAIDEYRRELLETVQPPLYGERLVGR